MTMELVIDDDVRAVAEFMQSRIPAARLVGVAAGVHAFAPLLWGRYAAEQVIPAGLSPSDPQPPLSAIEFDPELRCVGGGSAEGADGSE